ncbi:amino acid ABC transporter permease [Caldisalinibacter kiritimatiensis]|uniref:Amino acid ABC transporter, permease protein n=1 Tax=Caldisalinibacter kiritimatiensis TaxID=1304284 RepID=R1AVB3_9FIRM|nr:amino acid ABC transporter permease [Caldisalinibacter kiritimatiensis]EOD00587.1 amino acid ABC transporter, permease protein [Caldisalinibacter kiritimatiensis]
MEYIFDVSNYVLKGSLVTIKLYMITILFSIPFGIILALGKVSKYKLINILLSLYTWIFRGTPLLLQLFFFYFGLPVINITLTPFMAAAITFILNYSAYLTEIFRAGIQSIPKGQYEAAYSLGMDYWQTMIYIILPQTANRVLPPLSNEAITLVKDTALVAAIGMGDLLRAAKQAVTRDFNITPFILAAIFYLIFTSLIVTLFRKIEQKYSICE